MYAIYSPQTALFSHRSQMISKCGKNKKVAHEAIAECVNDDFLIYYWTDARQHGVYLFYTVRKQATTAFLFQIFLNRIAKRAITRKPAFAQFGKHEKKPFDKICCLYKMKQFHWLLCVTRNCDWSRKITPLSNLTQKASRGIKTYSESRIELRNLQMLRKCWKNQITFFIRAAL